MIPRLEFCDQNSKILLWNFHFSSPLQNTSSFSLSLTYFQATFEAEDRLRKITAKYSQIIESKDLDYSIEPQEDISPTNAKNWVLAHEEIFQPALTELVAKVKRIPFHAFKAELLKSIETFNQEILKEVDHTYTVLVEKGKSNLWVAEVAFPYIKGEPNAFLKLGEKLARDFIPYLNVVSSDKALKFPRNIILFDDGSYSGKQIYGHVKAIFDQYALCKMKMPKCFVVIPYMTEHAQSLLLDMQKRSKGHLFIAGHDIIPTIEKVVGVKNSAVLNQLFWKGEEKLREEFKFCETGDENESVETLNGLNITLSF